MEEMQQDLPSNTDAQTNTMNTIPEYMPEKKHTLLGLLIGILVVMLILSCAWLYFGGSALLEQEVAVDDITPIRSAKSNASEDKTATTAPTTGTTSDETSDIDTDLQSDIVSTDTESGEIDTALGAGI